MDKGVECLFEIRRIIQRLRGEGGCPWDRQQTPDSVKTYIIEEAHEAVDAIRRGDTEEVIEELGDLIFMVFFMIHLYEENGIFSLRDICERVCEKMIRRHPHVFGSLHVNSPDEVKDNWAKIKELEGKGRKRSEGVPSSLPALIRAYRLISRDAVEISCDDTDCLLRHFEEEITKIASNGSIDEKELGRLILYLVKLGKIFGIRAEDALQRFLDDAQRAE